MKYRYYLLDIQQFGPAYQEVDRNGIVTRYLDPDGVVLFVTVPVGLSSAMVDANPPLPPWAYDEPDPVQYPDPGVPSRRLTKLAFVGRLGDDFPVILAASKVDIGVEIFVRMLDWATPDPDGTSVDLDDPRVIYALNQLEAGGVIGPGRAAEILGA